MAWRDCPLEQRVPFMSLNEMTWRRIERLDALHIGQIISAMAEYAFYGDSGAMDALVELAMQRGQSGEWEMAEIIRMVQPGLIRNRMRQLVNQGVEE